jgi:hypothetical protein
MWATLTVEGEFEVHDGVPSLEQMQGIVKGPEQAYGLVEVVELKHGITMWINEEGKYEDPRRNGRATIFAREARSIYPNDHICGDVLFTGGPDEEGETQGLTDEQLAYVAQAARITEIGFPGSGFWNMTGVVL